MALIKCSECGTEISDQAPSCPKCGFPTKNIKIENKVQTAGDMQKREKPRKKTRVGLVIGLLFFGIIAVIALLYAFKLMNQTSSNSGSSVFNLIPQERQVNLVNGSIIVKSAQWKYYSFNTLKSWRNIHLNGKFEASGGSGDDIRLLVMTKNDFTNFTNGHQAYSIYDSGKLTVSNLNVGLPSETQDWVIAFDNTFSTVTDKEVNADISLIYTY